MIEKDLRARKKSPRSIKDYTTVIHRHWPNESQKSKNMSQQKTTAASTAASVQTQVAEDQLRDNNEFSDDEFDLPEMVEIFNRIPL